jgi:mono/diheme cytochrome c family protein
MITQRLTTVGLLMAIAMAAPVVAGAQQPSAAAPDGHELFQSYCASCHGPTGEGNGPAAPALRKRPPNLTLYAIQNSGIFPAMKLRRVVDGRDVVAHGNSDMPVWGSAFRTSKGGADEDTVKARIDAIVRYLESIQMMRS